MQPSKLQVKLFASENGDVERYVPVFHRWIRDNVLGELVLDVVDYRHVTDGPAVVLIGHAVDYALDLGGGELGLLHVRKRDALPESERLADALRRALRVAVLLEREPGLEQPLAFRGDRLLIRVTDRLAAPNTDETLRSHVSNILEKLVLHTRLQVAAHALHQRPAWAERARAR